LSQGPSPFCFTYFLNKVLLFAGPAQTTIVLFVLPGIVVMTGLTMSSFLLTEMESHKLFEQASLELQSS
jgi:hypothetical protein